jgi:hypothetical protein
MELINATCMQAGYTMGIDKDAREHVVVSIKGTFAFPSRDGEPAVLAPEQVPLCEADTFTGEPGLSAPLHEADYPLRKPRTDVLLNGSAHAPGGRPAERVQVGIKLGDWHKTFIVTGDRVWRQSGATVAPSRPQPFTTMRVTYDVAFGGIDDADPDPARHDAFMANPIGRGYHRVRTGSLIDGRLCACTEAVDDPVRVPWGNYRPMSLGPVGRGWQPRLSYAGTYDQHWIDHVFPFLPADFDDRYHQAAPEDQQLDEPKGGEEMVLVNLTPEGRTRLRLPAVEVPVWFFRKGGGHEERRAVLDTVLIEPDRRRLMLTWRASVALKRDIFEVPQALVGRRSRAWWRARELGKEYHAGIGALVRARREEAAE